MGGCPNDFPAQVPVAFSGEILGDPVIDEACEYLYIANPGANTVEVYDLVNRVLLPPIAVGNRPKGIDLSADGTRLYVANSGGPDVSVVDLATRQELRRVVVSTTLEPPNSIAVLDTGRAFVLTTFAGVGNAGHVIELDLSSETYEVRTDLGIFGGSIWMESHAYRSDDRSTMAIVTNGVTAGEFFLYSTESDVFQKRTFSDLYGYAGLSPDATRIAIAADGTTITDGALTTLGVVPGSSFGVEVSPDGRFGYRVVGPVQVLDLEDFTSTGIFLPLGDTTDRFFFRTRLGATALSQDGQLLAVITDHGFSIVRTNYQPLSATSTPTAASPTVTPTVALTPTATNTPLGASVIEIPESCVAGGGDPDNCDPLIPAANLWICVTGPCAGPGEGNLIVFEYATNILTGDQNGDTVADGLGAYEFSVEYDNFVIQSVNPSDVVFAPLGSINPYPNGTDGVLDGEGAARGPANCSFSLVFENVVHFGCVTAGQTPGPTGNMDLARLNLVPHPDLTNDIFPGNDNGVVTVIKDNGCETVDIFGHPTTGSVNGGLTPVCGDLAVTVRILEGDLNLDCVVDVQDQQLIAFRYGAFFGSLLYSKWYDLEPNLHDLDIDIKDIQKVFGRDGSTCQNPIGPQQPLPPPAPFGT